MTLIPRIGAAMVRSTTGTVGASEIRRHLRAVMSFPLPLPAGLNESLRLGVIEEAIPDEATVTDLDADSGSSLSGASTYGGNKVESMLGYVDEDVVVQSAWPKIQKKAAGAHKREAEQTWGIHEFFRE